VGDADGRDVEHRAEVEGQPGAARVVAAGGVDEKEIRRLGKCTDGSFEQRAFAQRQQSRFVGGSGVAWDDGRLLTDAGGRPCLVAFMPSAALPAWEADEDAADARVRLRQPGLRHERGQEQLLLDELLARGRPGGHACRPADLGVALWADQGFGRPALPKEPRLVRIARPLAPVRAREAARDPSQTALGSLPAPLPIDPADPSHTLSLRRRDPEAARDLVKLPGLHLLARLDPTGKLFELTESRLQPLLAHSPSEMAMIDLLGSDQRDGLLRNIGVAAGDELVEPVDEHVRGRQHRRYETAPQRHLVDLLARRREARAGRLDEDVRAGEHVMAPSLLEPKWTE